MRPFTTDHGLLERKIDDATPTLWAFDWTAIRCARMLYSRQNREAMEECMFRLIAALEVVETGRPGDERMAAFAEAVAEGIDAALMTLPGIKEELERRKAEPPPIMTEMNHG